MRVARARTVRLPAGLSPATTSVFGAVDQCCIVVLDG